MGEGAERMEWKKEPGEQWVGTRLGRGVSVRLQHCLRSDFGGVMPPLRGQYSVCEGTAPCVYPRALLPGPYPSVFGG